MSPWFQMPAGPEAVREAALADLWGALDAIRCAIRLLEATADSGRERELLSCVTEELDHVRRSVHSLAQH